MILNLYSYKAKQIPFWNVKYIFFQICTYLYRQIGFSMKLIIFLNVYPFNNIVLMSGINVSSISL